MSTMFDASRAKAISLRPLLNGGAELILTRTNNLTYKVTSQRQSPGLLYKGEWSDQYYNVYVDGELQGESRTTYNYEVRVITGYFSNGSSVALADRSFPRSIMGHPGTSQHVKLSLPGFPEEKMRAFDYSKLAALPVNTVVLVAYPFQRITDGEGIEWVTDGDLVAFPRNPPAAAERLQMPYSYIPLGYWQSFLTELEGRLIRDLFRFIVDFINHHRTTFQWILGEDGEQYVTDCESFLLKSRPLFLKWSSHHGLYEPEAYNKIRIPADCWDRFLSGLIGKPASSTELLQYSGTFRETIPFRWEEELSEEGVSRWYTNGYQRLAPRRDNDWWFIPPIPMGFWDQFMAGLGRMTIAEIRVYATRFLADIVGPFRWTTDVEDVEDSPRYMSNGEYSLPEQRPGRNEWGAFRPFIKQSIDAKYWEPYLEALEGHPLEDVLDVGPRQLIERAQAPRPPVLTDRQRRLRAVIGKIWKGRPGQDQSEPVAVGLCLRFFVNRPDELGSCYVIDNAAAGAIYLTQTADEANALCREQIRRSEVRMVWCHVDHIGNDWEFEVEWILDNVRAADLKTPAHWRRPK